MNQIDNVNKKLYLLPINVNLEDVGNNIKNGQ